MDLFFPFASFLALSPPLPSLLFHLSLPLLLPTLWGGARFPAHKLVGFWEESEDLIRDWNQLVCHLIQEGETQVKEEDLVLGSMVQPGDARERSSKEKAEWANLGGKHQGSP